jgi:hypothetical protein
MATTPLATQKRVENNMAEREEEGEKRREGWRGRRRRGKR